MPARYDSTDRSLGLLRWFVAGGTCIAIFLSTGSMPGQEVPEFSLAARGGVEHQPDENRSKAVLSAEGAARWDIGVEVGLGLDLSYRDREPSVCRAGGCVGGEEFGPFEKLDFWTVYLEPRYRLALQRLKLHPFLGGRIGLVRWVDEGRRRGEVITRSGRELAVVAGVEYRTIRRVSLEVSGLWGSLKQSRTPHSLSDTFDRWALRGGVRVHF